MTRHYPVPLESFLVGRDNVLQRRLQCVFCCFLQSESTSKQPMTMTDLDPRDITPDQKKAWESSSDFANYFCTYAYIYHQKQMLSDDLRMQSDRDAIFDIARHARRRDIVWNAREGHDFRACARTQASGDHADE